MTTLSDITTTPLSGLNHIDALLDSGPDWNFLGAGGNTITYTFSTSSGNETFTGSDPAHFSGTLESMTAAQQSGVRTALAYLSSLTGITFSETSNGGAASLHLANANLNDSGTAGLCSWGANYFYTAQTDEVTKYAVNAYVYLDNAEWGGRNYKLNAGGLGYETLLHELGHALGLKHPFEGDIQLPQSEDSTSYSLMSYTDVGGPYAQMSPYDVAALNWLYGGDGLGGALGIGSASGGRYLTGSARGDTLTGTKAGDILRGDQGDDMINGGEGNDTAVFSGASNTYYFDIGSNGSLLVQGPDGSDLLSSIEFLQFSDGSFSRDQVIDAVAPNAPSVNVSKNANGYVAGNTPLLLGIAEANATVKVFSGATQIGSATADAKGFWSTTAGALVDGAYTIFATATDAAGNISKPSGNQSFSVDAHAPSMPTGSVNLASSNANQAVFGGTAEVGTTISLLNTANGLNQVIATTTAGAGGVWNLSTDPLVNGSYNITVQSLDAAENRTDAASPLNFTVNSSLNRTGTANNDKLSGDAASNALDGGAGIDTAVYSGARAGFTVAKGANGYTVSSGAVVDSLVNVERITFADGALGLDINGSGGQAYRLYAAAMDRAPDLQGLGFWMHFLDNGMSLAEVAQFFLTSPEFTTNFGANLSDLQFVDTMYEHVLHRDGEEAGVNFYLTALAGGVSRADVLVYFSASPENQAQVIGSIQNGFEYLPYGG